MTRRQRRKRAQYLRHHKVMVLYIDPKVVPRTPWWKFWFWLKFWRRFNHV